MKYENKKFQVRRYTDFPHKHSRDVVIKEFDDLETANFDSIVRGRNTKGKGYYVIDSPHKDVHATPEQELAWDKAKRKCGLTK